MKKKMYVCVYEEGNGFMYYHYFSTLKKAKKFMKKVMRENNPNDYSASIVDARICEIIKTYKHG